jgi:hypothetical protein
MVVTSLLKPRPAKIIQHFESVQKATGRLAIWERFGLEYVATVMLNRRL